MLEKFVKKNSVVICNAGDGAIEEGSFYESLSMAKYLNLPIVFLIENNNWFFDTELLILAEKNGYRIKELPVIWTDDPDSKVRILKTALEDLKGLARLRFGGLRRASNLILLQKEQSHTNP